MKNKFLKNTNEKHVFIFLLSILLAVISVYTLLIIASEIYYISWVNPILRNIKYGIGMVPLVLGTGIILFLIFFLLMNRLLSAKKKLKYAEEISNELEKIAQGKLDTRIPIKSSGELGKLAENINNMAIKLQASMEEERNAEKTKNELVTSISHDLRTPLTSILGYLGLIANDQYKDEVELRYYIDIAYDKSQRLKKLIDELFEFTRISYGGIKLQSTTVDLVELLGQLTEDFFPIFQNHQMQCRVSIFQEKISICGDGDMLVRVFENIITNAIRYGKEGKYVDIELTQDDNMAIVKITNYGNPIPILDIPYVFDRFYRVEQSRSQSTGGTGLGLAIAKNIVDLHNGKISVFSNEESTTFEVGFNINKE